MEGTSPSGLSNGQTSTPKGEPPKIIRRHKTTDPLRPRKKPVERRQNVQAKPNAAGRTGSAPLQKGATAPARNSNPSTHHPSVNGARPPLASGASSQPGDYEYYPLVTTKKELRESMRFHLARFASSKVVDPADPDQFTRPIRLARRAPQDQRQRSKDEDVTMEDVPDSKERERLEILKAQKEARRAADQAQIAPVGNNATALAARKARSDRTEKTSQSRRKDKNEEQQKESALRYEEAFSWYLEDDAEPPNSWMGIYEAALSEVNVAFYADGSVFRMVPIEKWYKFIPKGLTKTMTTEEAEMAMKKKAKETRWAMREDKVKQERNAKEDMFRHGFGMSFAVKGESSTALRATKTEGRDMDDLDFDADDLFQDDDETMNYHPEKDEEAEAAKDKVKREQLGAGVFDLRDEREVDKEAEIEKRQEEARKEDVRGRKKHLKRDKAMIDDDSSDYDDPLKVILNLSSKPLLTGSRATVIPQILKGRDEKPRRRKKRKTKLSKTREPLRSLQRAQIHHRVDPSIQTSRQSLPISSVLLLPLHPNQVAMNQLARKPRSRRLPNPPLEHQPQSLQQHASIRPHPRSPVLNPPLARVLMLLD